MENALEDGFINEVELDIKDSTLENHVSSITFYFYLIFLVEMHVMFNI